MKISKITIGLPVYNVEKTIEKTLNSIVKQTFTDFQVIISDNHSTDNTAEICKKFSKKYSNIKYFQQNENKGPLFNFKFVLNSANSEYFVWLAADDWWEPSFLEKNIGILDAEKKFVGSISKIDYYNIQNENNTINKNSRIRVKKNYSYKEYENVKKYSDRVSFYLRLNRAENFYGIYRRAILIQCVEHCLKKESIAMDLKLLLFIQRFGEINLINETLLHRSGRGSSSKYSQSNALTEFNDYGIIGEIFPFLSFSIWILKKLGFKIFLRNIDYILLINAAATKYQLKKFIKKS